MARKRTSTVRPLEKQRANHAEHSPPPRRIPAYVWLLCLFSLVALVVSGWWTLRRTKVDIPSLLDQAQAALERGDLPGAASLLRKIQQVEPQNPMALLYLGQMANSQGEAASALEIWGRVSDEPPQMGGTARFLEATAHLQRHEARLAEAKLLKSARLNPRYLQPRERLVELYVLQMRGAEIREQLDAIRQLRPWSLHESVLQLVAGQRIQTVEEGIRLTESFVVQDPDDVASWMALAQYYRDADRISDAIDALRPVIARLSHEDGVRGLLGCLLVQDSREEEARELLVGHDPAAASSPWLWQATGEVAAWQADFVRAVHCFQMVVKQQPDDVAARYRLGSLLTRSGSAEESRKVLDETVILDRLQRQIMIAARGTSQPTESLVALLTESADLLRQLGRAEQARHWYQLALAADPSVERARRGLAETERMLAGGPAAQTVAVSKVEQSAVDTRRPPENVAASGPKPAPQNASTQGASRAAHPAHFRNEAKEAGIQEQYFNGQSGLKYLIESMGGGVGVPDFDRDGWPDLYFPQGCELPFKQDNYSHIDRLYRNGGNGRFLDVTDGAKIDENRYSLGCAVGDLDNDGHPDLIIGNYGRCTVYHNLGDGTFRDITLETGMTREHMYTSVAVADLNRDGNLDVYLVNYVDSLKVCRNPQGKISTCDPNNFRAEQDRIYLNRGDGTFEDCTEASGIVAADGKGLGVVVADLDDDGWPDIYVANDGTPNFLFRNVTGSRSEATIGGPAVQFVEEGLIRGAAVNWAGQAQAGMGIACGDLNGDQYLDLVVTNFYLESSTVYQNQGQGWFVDASRSAGLAAPTRLMLGFGTQFADFDLNGRPDLFVANGHIDDHEEASIPWKMPPQLFSTSQLGHFRETSEDAGDYFRGKYLGRGVARLDWNRDGRPDLVVMHQDSPAALLTNDGEVAGNSVVIEIHGVDSNRDGLGARALVTAAGETQLFEWSSGDGFCASNEQRQFVGVAHANRLDKLELNWPSGRKSLWNDLPVDCRLVVVEGREVEIRKRTD